MTRARALALLAAAVLPVAAHAKAAAARLPSVADGAFTSRPVAMMGLLAGMSLLPFAVLMLTSFAKISVVLSIARSAIGSQQLPPTTVLTGLAMVLTAHVMAPVAQDMVRAWRGADLTVEDAAAMAASAGRVAEPLRAFLVRHGSADDRAMFLDLARELRGGAGDVSEQDPSIVVPAFVVGELREAFQIGFLLFLPFLVLDMVVANILLALGMQTLSPTQVSLPFKLLLFVMVDGFSLLAKGLVLGYAGR